MLRLTSRAALAAALGPHILSAAGTDENRHGAITGEPTAAAAGYQILADGGNAVDAIIAAALVAGVVSPQNCGLGGYGGHLVIAPAGGRNITAIDYNSPAPLAARADMFPADEHGAVRGRVNEHGWLASGVPGTLAGLELALKRHGTRTFRELAQPALKFARDGFPVSPGLAAASRGLAAVLRQDAGSAKILLNHGEPLKAGDTYRNPDLAQLLETLANQNSVAAFYRGDLAQRIAEAFQKNGGLLTAKDLAAYQAREVKPLALAWRGFSIHTAPLTAGGLTVLEALMILKALGWESEPVSPARTHARLEALRLAWRDRLELLGDPEHAPVPVARLLSEEHAQAQAEKVRAAVKERKPLALQTVSRPHGGTVHLSCADKQGNLVALTLTHGNSFGACVTVDGLGLTLGHGMSRFEPKPGHPNSPGPGKRPLHNMCPSVVLHEGKPVFALGGAGGRKIPNAVFDVLLNGVALGASIEAAVAAPRLHTEGNREVTLEKAWPEAEAEHLQTLGFTVQNGVSARVSAVSFDPRTAECRATSR